MKIIKHLLQIKCILISFCYDFGNAKKKLELFLK